MSNDRDRLLEYILMGDSIKSYRQREKRKSNELKKILDGLTWDERKAYLAKRERKAKIKYYLFFAIFIPLALWLSTI